MSNPSAKLMTWVEWPFLVNVTERCLRALALGGAKLTGYLDGALSREICAHHHGRQLVAGSHQTELNCTFEMCYKET